MTEEQKEEYKKLFILCLEVGGDITGDPYLLNIENLVRNCVADEFLESSLIFDKKDGGVEIGDYVTILLISTLLHSKVDRGELDTDFSNLIPMLTDLSNEIMEKAAEYYYKYLKSGTEKFCKDHQLKLSLKFSNKYGKEL